MPAIINHTLKFMRLMPDGISIKVNQNASIPHSFCNKIYPLPIPNWCIDTFKTITQPLLAEQVFPKNERCYANLAKMSFIGIFRTDLLGNCLYVNQRWSELSGISFTMALGKGWRAAIHPDDLNFIDAEVQRILPNANHFNYEFRFQHPDGKIIWVLSQAETETCANGEAIGYIGTVVDITEVQQAQQVLKESEERFAATFEQAALRERKLAELTLQQRAEELTRSNTILAQTTAMLQKRNQELDRFVYVASHDLKAPLRAIASLSEWLEEDLAELLPPENQHQMQLLRGRVRRMEALINGLLEYSRIGRIHTESSLVNVGELLQEVIDLLQPPATFTIEIAPGMPTFITKRFPLQQVFTNLIENAIKHHSRIDGRVKISVQDQGRYYKFAIADDGPGIALEYHDKIFVIFQTLEARDRKENTGIGLAIVKKIVETEGGTIILNSNLGAGSTFHFTWPKQPDN